VSVSQASLAVVYRQLGLLLASGVSLTEALRLLLRRSHGRLRVALDAARVALGSGATLRDALGADPAVFSERARAFVGAGETSGTLPAIFAELASDLEMGLGARRRIVRAALYPATLLTLSFFLLPLAKLVSDGVAAYLRAALLPWAITVVAGVAAVRFVPPLLRARPTVWRRVPLVLTYERLTFVRQLGAGLHAGLDVYTALALAAGATGDPDFAARIAGAAERVRAGQSLEDALAPTGLFDDEILLTVAGGEAAGRLDTALAAQARLLSDQLLHRLEILIQLVATATLLAVYAVVAWRIYLQYRQALGGSPDLERLLKELEPGALPPELR